MKIAGLLSLIFLPVLCAAQTFTIVHSFNGSDGYYVYAGVTQDRQGNLFGATDDGVLYEVSPSGAEKTLYKLSTSQGRSPHETLLIDASGDIYGSATAGGVNDEGTLFELTRSGQFRSLSFGQNGTSQGWDPLCTLIPDPQGNLYGTTIFGGPSDNGTIFKLDHNTHHKTVLYNFGFVPDGNFPGGRLLRGADDSLYGYTGGGGKFGDGTIYKLSPAGMLTILYEFSGADGELPSGLIRGEDGVYYGTTALGGVNDAGTVFRFDPSAGVTVLYSFGENEYDGAQPMNGVVSDTRGNLYGTTYLGGSEGVGTVFKLDTLGNLTILHDFARTDGTYPYAGLLMGPEGNLYGTTMEGGPGGYGVVFKISGLM